MNAVIGMVLHPITETQLISVEGRESSQSVLFFDDNTKMAFWATPGSWREGYVFIWDLESNKIEKIPGEDLGDYNDLIVENDKLYTERINSSVSKKLIAE